MATDLNVVMKGRFFIDKFIVDRKQASLQQKITATKIAIMNVADIHDAVKGVIESSGLVNMKTPGSRAALSELKHWEDVLSWLKQEYYLVSGNRLN